jgi:putative membrane protein
MGSATARIKQFLIGILVGIASMLPGISGAIVAVCFGIYERLVKDLADIVHQVRKDFMFLLVVGCGILIGMVVIAFGLNYMGDNARMASMFLFLGLIAGQIPTLYYTTEPKTGKPSRYNYAALAIGVIIMGSFLLIGTGKDQILSHDLTSYLYMVFVGIFLAISKLAPGISGSTVLLVFGLFYPLVNALTGFDMALLLPLGIGLLIGLLGFSKVINYALTKHRRSTYFMILGLTIGSIVTIAYDTVPDITCLSDVIIGVITLAIGILISLWFMRLGNNNSEEILLD